MNLNPAVIRQFLAHGGGLLLDGGIGGGGGGGLPDGALLRRAGSVRVRSFARRSIDRPLLSVIRMAGRTSRRS